MSTFIKTVFRRATIVGLLIVIQAIILVGAVWRLSNNFVYVYAVFELLSIGVVLWILSRKDNPSYKIAWIFPILIFPIFGGLFYLLFGRQKTSAAFRRGIEKSYLDSVTHLRQDPQVTRLLEQEDPRAARQSSYLTTCSLYPAYADTQVEYFCPGEKKFEALKRELEAAEHFIFLEYFIIEEGVMWNAVLEILERKVQEGVDVRVMYDDIGCAYTLPAGYFLTLREKGIKCHVFNPFKPVMSVQMNNRDHRKIVVIDGHTGFTGGINLADEYINVYPKHGHWKDSAVMLKGEAVWNLTVMFLQVWDYMQKSQSDYSLYSPHVHHPDPFLGEGIVQPFSDSPLDGETVGENVYLNIIGRAQRYVYINTPYLIVDNEMVTSLALAAKSGVDVRITTPHVADKWYVHMVTRSYYAQLIEAGVKIYEYTPGFVHAKSFVCDDEIATVGTINLDYRSLYLHFECGVWMFRAPCIADIKKDFMETLELCQLVTLEECRNIPLYKRLLRGLLRMFAPLM